MRVLYLAVQLLFVTLVISQDFNAVSNAGEEFFLMLMPNIVERGTHKNAQAVLVSNADAYETAVVNVTLSRGVGYADVSVGPRTSVRLTLPTAAVHRLSGLGKHAVHIQSSRPVNVIGVNRLKFSTDTFLVLPKSSLGVGYIGACYTANIRTQIGIVATEDDTLIRVTLPKRPENPDFAVMVEHNGIYYSSAAGVPYQFTIRMNRLESYLLTSFGDLTATQIRSNKRINVFGSNVRAKVGRKGRSRDHVVEQLMPVYAWQHQWYTVPTPHRNEPDVYRVLSNTAGTRVSVQLSDGTDIRPQLIETPRDFIELKLPQRLPAMFSCSPNTCLVYQISASISKIGLGDPSMFIASNPEAFGSYKYVYIAPESVDGRPYDRNTLVIMSRGEATPKTYFQNGTSYIDSIQWKSIEQWGINYALLDVYTEQTVVLKASRGPPFVLWMHGMSDRESYGHSLGYRISSPKCMESDRSLMSPGDGMDNDCDSLIDEEPGIDGIDNDNDGRIDEDAAFAKSKLSSGMEYAIVFMENRVEFPVSAPLELFLGGLNVDSFVPTKVSVSYPLQGALRNTIELYVYSREVHRIELNHTVMQRGTGLKSKAIHIKADNDLVVYGINKEQFSADGFIAIPISSYGKVYFAVSYYPPTSRSEFAVVAPKNDTTVRIYLPLGEELRVEYPGHTYLNGDSFTVRMDALQTLQIQDASGEGDLSGTKIVADKIIGVFSGNVRTFVTYDGVSKHGSRDHLVEQLPPVNSYGTRFAMMTTPGRSVGDAYKIVSSEKNTVVTICTRVKPEVVSTCRDVSLPKEGSHHTEHLFVSDVYVYMESNKPIMVVQITRSQVSIAESADPVMMLIAPIQQYSKDYTFLTPTLSNPDVREDYKFHYLYVIIDRKWTAGLMVDNNATSFGSAVWEDIPNSNTSQHNMVATFVTLPFALHTLTHTEPAAIYMGLLYGFADRESYGFPIGLKMDTLYVCEPSVGMEGDQVDNDCDDLVDEEICGNDLDDDNDGRLDEDCALLPTSYTYLAVFMENNVEYPPANYPLRLYGASYDKQVVRVTTPKYTFRGLPYDRAQVIDNEEILNFGMRPDIRHIGSSVNSRGIVVRSEYPIDLFGSNEERFSHDCFLVLPTALLGREYYSVHSSPSTLQQQLAITAAEDNTEVIVELSATLEGKVEFNLKVFYAGESIKFTLNIGQSAQVQTKDLPASGLTGTRVVSNKPVAVFSGNVRTSISLDGTAQKSRDHIVEQLLPYLLWRQQYIAPSTPIRYYMDVFIFITKENAQLEVENERGEVTVHSLEAIQSNSLLLPSGDTHSYIFSADKPFQVVRLTPSQVDSNSSVTPSQVDRNSSLTDPAMLLLLHADFWKNRFTFAPPVFTGGSYGGDYVNVIQIVIDRSKTNGIRLNDRPVTTVWNRVGSSSYSITNIQIAHVPQISLSHKDNALFMAYLYGAADRESYAMPCGINLN